MFLEITLRQTRREVYLTNDPVLVTTSTHLRFGPCPCLPGGYLHNLTQKSPDSYNFQSVNDKRKDNWKDGGCLSDRCAGTWQCARTRRSAGTGGRACFSPVQRPED